MGEILGFFGVDFGADLGFFRGGAFYERGGAAVRTPPPPPNLCLQMKKGNTMQQFLQKALEILRRDFSELRC